MGRRAAARTRAGEASRSRLVSLTRDLAPLGLALATLDSRQDVLDQLADPHGIEGLDDVPDTPQQRSSLAVGQIGAGGEEDDRNLACPRVPGELLGDAPTIQ